MTSTENITTQRKVCIVFIQRFAVLNVLLFLLFGNKFLSSIFSSQTLFETTFYAYTSLPGKTLPVLFALLAYTGQLALLASLPLFLITLPLILLGNKKLLTLFSIITASCCAVILIADSYIFSLFHFHLNLFFLKMIWAERTDPQQFFNLSNREFITISIAMLSIIFTEVGVAAIAWRKIHPTIKWRLSSKMLIAFLVCLLTSYYINIASIMNNNNIFTQQTPNLPLYNVILAKLIPGENSVAMLDRFSETRFSQPLFPERELQYPLHPLQCKALVTPPNIIIIGIDSWRYDAVTATLMPKLTNHSKQAMVFNQHFSGGNSTQAGLFSLFYALPNNYFTSMKEQNRGSVFIHALLNQHYQTQISASADLTMPPFAQTIFTEINDFRHSAATGNTIPDKDRMITQEMITALKNRNIVQPFFGFLFYDAAHGYCGNQNIDNHFGASAAGCNRMVGSMMDNNQELIKRYNNAVFFIDGEIGKILTTLKSLAMEENTIIIITGDHGEEFNDTQQNYYGHGSNYSSYQIRTPLIVYWPHKSPQVIQSVTSHYDIVPTLMSNALGCTSPYFDYSMGLSLFQPKLREYLIVGSYINRAVVEKDRSTTLLTSGSIRIADDHARELPLATPNMKVMTSAMNDMERFYH